MIELKIDEAQLKRVNERLNRLSMKDRSSAVRKSFTQCGLFLEKKLKQNVSGRYLHVRTGRLRGSLGSITLDYNNQHQELIGSGVRSGKRVVYANILETGGIIRPVNRKYLTIPLKPALTPAGVPRFTAQEVRQGLTQYKGSFIRKGVIFGKTGNKITPLFVLKKQVVIPPKRYMEKTAVENAKAVGNMLEDTINEVANGKK